MVGALIVGEGALVIEFSLGGGPSTDGRYGYRGGGYE